MRVIVPPLTSQYLNLIKNSSLAVAIGYPDLVQVFTGSVLFITGQAVEMVAVTMAVYLTISLVTSLLMNWYGHAVARRGALNDAHSRGRTFLRTGRRTAAAAVDTARHHRLDARKSVFFSPSISR